MEQKSLKSRWGYNYNLAAIDSEHNHLRANASRKIRSAFSGAAALCIIPFSMNYLQEQQLAYNS